MVRSILPSSSIRLLCMVLLLAIINIDQIQGLSAGGFFRQRHTSSTSSSSSSVVSRGGGSSRTGKKNNSNIRNNQSNDYELPTTHTQETISTTGTTRTTSTNTGVSSSSFDADSYRQQMTDLVYQRNLQRCI
mmetsp:Transcript_14296/g.16065  ORF Transcript_14296/g.16065 Transcript_14296/m.16065 type:complete len:132 (-) Transcript_14296:237-632(-)